MIGKETTALLSSLLKKNPVKKEREREKGKKEKTKYNPTPHILAAYLFL